MMHSHYIHASKTYISMYIHHTCNVINKHLYINRKRKNYEHRLGRVMMTMMIKHTVFTTSPLPNSIYLSLSRMGRERVCLKSAKNREVWRGESREMETGVLWRGPRVMLLLADKRTNPLLLPCQFCNPKVLSPRRFRITTTTNTPSLSLSL